MRRFRYVSTPMLAMTLGIVAASAVAAATSTPGTAKFSVPVSVSIAQGSGGTCTGGNCDFGSPALGILSPAQTDDLTITSNDALGYQITGGLNNVTQVVETGTCTINPAHNIAAVGPVKMTGAATTGGTGGAGTGAAQQTVGGTALNIFSTGPTAIGTMDELVTMMVLPDASTPANTAGCAYTIGFAFVVVAG